MDLSTFMYIDEGAKVHYDGRKWTVKRVDALTGKMVIRHPDTGDTERVHHKETEVESYA